MLEKIIDKNYGSIPHMQTSKLNQQADKKISLAQEEIATKKTRDWKDLVIVTEKIDGSNVGVYRTSQGRLVAITRSGYEAKYSKFKQHRVFADFVMMNYKIFDWLPSGWRVVGEWCFHACGTIYDLDKYSPFVAFDIFTTCNKRLPYIDFLYTCARNKIPIVPLLHIGGPLSLKNALKLLDNGHYGKLDSMQVPEGVVYRVERAGQFDFIMKWVHENKEDGKYMKNEIVNKNVMLNNQDYILWQGQV